MPQRKDVGKKLSAVGKKGIAEKARNGDGSANSMVKPEKIAFSFTAMANLNDGGRVAGSVPYIWVSKESMIRCALSYGDTVIVQSMKEGAKIIASGSGCFV